MSDKKTVNSKAVNTKEKKTPFKFNLLSKKYKDDVKVVEARDESTVYSFILVFLGVLLYFFLGLLQIVFVARAEKAANTNLTNIKTDIDSFNDVRILNGELFTKSSALTPILEKDIQVKDFLAITTSVVGNSEIIGYQRQNDGNFIVEVKLSAPSKIPTILSNAEKQERIQELFVQDVTVDPTSSGELYILTFQFKLKA